MLQFPRTRGSFVFVAVASLALLVPRLRAFAQDARAVSRDTLTRPAMPAMSPTPGAAVESLGDYYALALRANPRIAAAQALARAAQARVPSARRPSDPQLQLGFMNYSLPGLAPMDPLGMVQLQLMQMLPLGNKLALAGQSAQAQAAAVAARVDEVAWELRAQVAMAYYDVAATDRSLASARTSLRLLRDIATTSEAMYRVGEGRQADVLRARVEIARMAEDTLRMLAMRETMRARLNALVDRASDDEVTAAFPRFPDSLPARPWLDSIASAARPMVRAGLEQLRAAETGERLARKELIPDLQLGVQYGQRSASGMEGGRSTERMGSLMIGASIPVFARDRQLQMREEALAMRQMAHADLASMHLETRGKVGEAYAALQRARRLRHLYVTEILPQAEAAVTSALAAYRAGSVDFMTLLDNQMNVNRYRQELATLDAEQGKAWAELEMLAGRSLIDATSTHGSAPGGTR